MKKKREKPQRPDTLAFHFRPRHDRQRSVVEAWAGSKAMMISGPAGTGKTAVSLAMAMQDVQSGRAERIWLCRPAVPVEEDLGFIPGGLDEKLTPWLAPFCDVMGSLGTEFDRWRDVLECVSIGQLGGRTVRNATLIIDEAQNATYRQLKMALTRVGQDGRVVMCGDYGQTEIATKPNPYRSVMDRLKGMAGVSLFDFRPEDQLRDEFVSRVLERV